MPSKTDLLFDLEDEWMRSLPIWFNGFGRPQITLDKNYYLHLWVLQKKKGFEIDHIDGNPLNNKKENLRHCNRSQNLFNRKIRSDSNQKYKGIQELPSGKFRARGPGGKHWGCFSTEEEAYNQFINKSKDLYGKDFVDNCKNI